MAIHRAPILRAAAHKIVQRLEACAGTNHIDAAILRLSLAERAEAGTGPDCAAAIVRRAQRLRDAPCRSIPT